MWCGIDFGTTNCSLSLMREQGGYWVAEPQDISEGTYRKVMRNVVLFSTDRKEVFAGDSALLERRRRSQEGEEFYFLDYYKPFLDEANLRQTLSVPENKGVVVERTLFPDRPQKSELVRATGAVLKKIIHSLDPEINSQIEGYVIGVPTLFSHLAKCRILNALVEGGVFATYREALGLVKFVPEPVGASMLFTPPSEEESNLLVFDFGGGSLDLALLHCKPDNQGRLFPISELALGGLDMAGRYIDEKIYREIIERDDRYQKQSKFLSYYDQILHLEQVENLKKRLSFEESAEEWIGNLPFVVHQKRLESLFRPELKKIEEALRAMLAKGGLSFSKVNHIVMVGGSSVIPWVQKMVESLFPQAVEKGLIYKPNPSEWEASPHQYEQAITGLSQGLALYHHQEKKNREFYAGYSTWDSERESHVDIVPQHVSRNSKGFVSTLPVCPEYSRLTISLFRNTIDYEFLINIVDIPFEPGEMDLAERFELEIIPDPMELFPRLNLMDREKGKFLLEFSPSRMSEEDLRRIFQFEKSTYQGSRNEVVPPAEWSWRPSPKLLEVGDVIKTVSLRNGKKIESKPFIITSITQREDRASLSKMESWDFSNYLVNGEEIPNRDLHLLSLDKVLVEERESIAKKLEKIHRQSKIVRIVGRPQTLREKLEKEKEEREELYPSPTPAEGLQPFDEEKLFSDVFRSFKRLTTTYNTMFTEVNQLKGKLREMEEDTIVRSELDLEMGTLRKQLTKYEEMPLKLAEFASEIEHFDFRLAKLREILLQIEKSQEAFPSLQEEVVNLSQSTGRLEEKGEKLAWEMEKKHQELSSFFTPLEKSLASLREEMGVLQKKIHPLEKLPEIMEKGFSSWEKRVSLLEEKGEKRVEEFSARVQKIEEGLQKDLSQHSEEWLSGLKGLEREFQKKNQDLEKHWKGLSVELTSKIAAQEKQLKTVNEQMEIVAKESLSKVGSEVHTLRGKFLKYKKRGIIWAVATVFWGIALLSGLGFVTYQLRQELKNQRLVASGNLALAVRDYEGAEKYFRQIHPHSFIGMAEEEQNRLVALARAGKHIELGNQLLGDGRYEDSAREYQKALELFSEHHLVPQHVKERLNRVEAFAQAEKLSTQGKLFLSLSLYRQIAQEKTDVPGSLYAGAMEALLLEKIKSMALEYIFQQKWLEASKIYERLYKLYPQRKIFQNREDQAKHMNLALEALKKNDKKKAAAHIKQAPYYSQGFKMPPPSDEEFWKELLGKDAFLVRRLRFDRFLREGDQNLLQNEWEGAFQFYEKAERELDLPAQKDLCNKKKDNLKVRLQREVESAIITDQISKSKRLQQLFRKLFPEDQDAYGSFSLKIRARELALQAKKEEIAENYREAYELYKKAYYLLQDDSVLAQIRFLASYLLKKQIEEAVSLTREGEFKKAKSSLMDGKRFLVHASTSLQKKYKSTLRDIDDFKTFFEQGNAAFQKRNFRKALFYLKRAQYIYASSRIEVKEREIHQKIAEDYNYLLRMVKALEEEGNWEGAREVLLAAGIVNPQGKEIGKLKDKLFLQHMLGRILKSHFRDSPKKEK